MKAYDRFVRPKGLGAGFLVKESLVINGYLEGHSEPVWWKLMHSKARELRASGLSRKSAMSQAKVEAMQVYGASE